MAKEFVGQEYIAATHGKGLHQETKGMRILGRVTITLSLLISLCSVGVIAFCVIFSLCPINGTSMMTTLNATGYNTDSAITCILGEPDHGDIIISKLYLKNTANYLTVIKAKQGDPQALRDYANLKKRYNNSDAGGDYMLVIKRLIGKPGDKISMRRINYNYYIYLNGAKLNESYLDPLVAAPNSINFIQLWNVLNYPTSHQLADWQATRHAELVQPNAYADDDISYENSLNMLIVPDGYYFMMGDNRNGYKSGDVNISEGPSWDSSYFGPLPIADYVSRCVDIIDNNISMPEYLWSKFVYYVCFGWAWQK